jgi:hypothetical protein
LVRLESIGLVVIFLHENLQRTCLVRYAVHTVNLQVATSVKSTPSNNVFYFEFASRVSVLLFANTLVYVADFLPNVPNFIFELVEELSIRELVERIWLVVFYRIEIQFPVLVFVLNAPLHDTLVAY